VFTVLDFIEFVNATRKKLPVKKQNVEFDNSEDLAFIMNKQSDWDEPWKQFLTDEYKKTAKYRRSISTNLGSTMLDYFK
jgi:hypothetical protein